MNLKTIIRNIIAVFLGIAITALALFFALKISFFNETVFDYAVNNCDYISELGKEINENAAEVIELYDLSHVLDVEESLASFDFPSEVVRYFHLRMQGIDTEIDNKAFRSYNHKMVDPVIASRGLSPEASAALINEIDKQLLLAYNIPFLYSPLTLFLNSSSQYQKLLDYLIYLTAGLCGVFLFFSIILKAKKFVTTLYLVLTVSCLSSIITYLVINKFNFKNESASFAVFINGILNTTALLMQFVCLFLFYALLVLLVSNFAKFIFVKWQKKRQEGS